MNKKMTDGKSHQRILEFFLSQVIPIADQENLTGDFEEMYDRIYRRSGKAPASIWYIFQIIKLLPSYFKNYVYWSLAMFINYFKIAVRHIRKFKTYSFITIAGLAIGMACCLLILFYIKDEMSYDRYHKNAARIYRVVDSLDVPGGIIADFALTSAPFAPALKQDFQEVEDAVRLIPRRRLVASGEKKYYEDGLFYADASLFNIFTFPLVKGNPATALENPNTVVISERMALKYFGNEEAINSILEIDETEFQVTGVMKDMPTTSHFYAGIFASLKTLEQNPKLQEDYFRNWIRHEFYTYILLREGSTPAEIQAKLPAFVEKYAAQQIKKFLGGSLSSQLQPLIKIHLHSDLQVEIRSNSDIKYVYIFSVIAFFILLIACFNFMNLATARAANRSKEVGLRKVVGANRHQLIKQFLGESLLFTFFAMLLAIAIVIIALPQFNSLTGKAIHLNYLTDVFLIGFVFLILVFVGIISGSYPAFFISRFQPAQVLKRALSPGSRKPLLRRTLVVLQFCISIILLISTVIVFNQLDFLRNRKLGFNKDHVVAVPIRADSIRQNVEEIKSELMRNPNIVSATIANALPGGNAAGDVISLVTEEERKIFTLRMIYTDHDYIKTMGIEMAQGRDFSKSMGTDADEAFIINEAAVREMQLTDPLKATLEYGFSETEAGKRGRIVGVITDYQFQSLKEEITPLVIQIWPSSTSVFAIRIQPMNIPDTLKFIETKWKEYDPVHPYEYSFMDETFDQMYKSEERMGQIFSTFSTLAIFIAAMGLFGLSLFMVETRTKEIGVRKVLGASAGNIFVLISKEFAILVLIANIFAWPAAYILMRKWLQSFAYRIDIGLWIFVASSVLAFVIALLTVSLQAIKAATANPTDSLRYE
jgi:putative ABC transport system permease protein